MMTTDEQATAFQELLNEMSGALADAVGLMQAGHATSDELRQTLSDISDAVTGLHARQDASKPSFDGVIAAIRSLRTEAATPASHTIQVNPTPVEMHNHLPAPVVQVVSAPQCDYVITHEYNTRGQAEKSTVTRLPVARS